MIFNYKHKTMFDIIKEAEEDEVSDTAQSNSNADNTPDEAPSVEESNTDEDDFGAEDEFDINTDLDTDNGEVNNNDNSSSDTSNSSSTESSSDEEETNPDAVEDNTNIFSSLSVEEQKIKITELKKLFGNLYNSTSDLMDKISKIEVEEDTIEILDRISTSLYSLKIYMKDYILNKFSQRSFIENDITFNRFLAILNSISTIIDELSKFKEQK